jgi:pimeloyl-ACP methyl ester carboxylesterase
MIYRSLKCAENASLGLVNDQQGDIEDQSLIFLHGLFGCPDNWKTVIDVFSTHFRIFAPELPLFDNNESSCSVPEFSELVMEKATHQGITSAVIAGNSLGGHIAMDIALRHPHFVQGLILTGSGGLVERSFEKSVPRKPSADYLRPRIMQIFYDKSLVSDELVEWVRTILWNRSNARRLIKIARSARRYKMLPYLKDIICPCLLIWGEDDEITPKPVAEMFHRELPDSELRWVSNCGHAPMIEHPLLFARLAGDFVSRMPIRSA